MGTANVEIRPGSSGAAVFNLGQKWIVQSGYALRFARDGNLEVANPHGSIVWQSRTSGKGAKKLALQDDGNLVIYGDAGRALWSTNTDGHKGAYLAVQDDGNIVLYASGKAIWSTGTCRK